MDESELLSGLELPSDDAEGAVEPESSGDEKKFQASFHACKKDLVGRAGKMYGQSIDDMSLLPKERWGCPAQVAVLGVSPYGNVWAQASPAITENKQLHTLFTAFATALSKFQKLAFVVSKQQAEAGEAVLPERIQGIKRRKQSVFTKRQAFFREFFQNVLVKKVDQAISAKLAIVTMGE